jgi:DUF4097 and DUF4098 domain-containing protein YvlB
MTIYKDKMRNIMKNTFIKTIAIASSILLLTISSAYADIVDTIEKSFTVDSNASLRLSNVNGGVEIQAWDKDEIKVTAVITADSQEDRDRIEIEFDQNSRGVIVETEYKNESSWGNNHNLAKVEYTVMVPFSATLSAIELVNGSLRIEGIEGEINADTVNGSIQAEGLTTNGEFNSVNGSIKVSYKSLSNEIDDIELATVNGSIKLYVPADISASVNAETMHGSIKTDFGLHAEKNMFSGRNLEGNIGSGDIRINIESVNGSVKILKN